MADDALQGTKNIYDTATPFNAMSFMIRRMTDSIATAIPVKVVAAESEGSSGATGYADVLPLVTYVSGSGEAIQPVTLYHLPYSRVQGGVAAVVIDPVPGDIGLAVFAHADSSLVTAGTTEPQQPGSFRRHSQSDGFYIGGFLNQAPTCYLELMQDNTATLHATGGVTIDGDITVNGRITATGEIKGDGHSLSTHTHTGVHGETSTPNG